MDNEKTAADAIREARKAAGLSQQRMADIMEIPRRTIEEWEAGRRTPPGYVVKLVVAKLENMEYKNKEKFEKN